MTPYSEQLRLIPPETSLERTLRTGNIDVFGALSYSMQDMVTIFDEVLARPEHYYREDRTSSISPAPFLGETMLRQSVEAVYQGTSQDMWQMQTPLFDSVIHHMFRKDPPEGTLAEGIAYELQRGIQLEQAALDVLQDATKSPRFIFNVLRADNGFNAKVFCLIMDAPGKILHLSTLQGHVEEPEKVTGALRPLCRAQGIKPVTRGECDWGYEEDPDPQYTQSDYFRYNEDSEVMVLARFHARMFDQNQSSETPDAPLPEGQLT